MPAESLVVNEGDDAREPRARPLHLDGEAGDLEAVGPGQRVEVRELLDLAVRGLDPGEVGRPDEPAVARALVVLAHRAERPVEAERVDADDLDAVLLHEPE